MTTTIILTIFSFCAVCAIPLFILHRKAKRLEKKTLQQLFSVARMHDDRVASYDLLDQLAIGLSADGNTLFFINNNGEGEIKEVVNLADVAQCNLHKPIRWSLDGKDSTIERIALVFTFRDKNALRKQLEFYDLERQSLTLNGELQLAERWHKALNDKLAAVTGKDPRPQAAVANGPVVPR